jgi:thiol-disulfide isomerase/thioredoxin
MARARPILATAVLSAAAALGYLSYRLIDGADAPQPADVGAALQTQARMDLIERVPDITLEGLAGEPVALTSWPGKALVINFWATWCTPCLKEIPMLKALKEERNDVEIVGIAIFDDRDKVAAFARDMAFNYPALHGQSERGDATMAFGPVIQNLPFTLFAAPDGSMLGAHVGELKAEHLENFTAVVDDLAASRIDLAEARARIAGRM